MCIRDRRNGYPLAIEVEKLEEVEAEFNADFMVRMVEKIDYAALVKTVAAVCARSPLPSREHASACSACACVHALNMHARSFRVRTRVHAAWS